MKSVADALFALRDEEYAAFQAKLTPTVPGERFIGVRVPEVRKLAKTLKDDPRVASFLRELPHAYYDENMFHGIWISNIRDFDRAIAETDRFLPFVDNWAVCDIMSPKVFAKNKDKLLPFIKKWIVAEETYTIRFGIEMLMSHYLDEDFKTEYAQIVAGIRSEEYYVRMMIAWYFATALAKQWEHTVPFVEDHKLDPWTHNKTISKAVESYRIPDDRKAYLKTLKIK